MLEKLSSANSTAIDCTQIKGIFIESLQNLLNEWRTTSFNVRRILGGKSGASVYLVDIKCDKHNGQAILKLSQSALTDDIKGMQIAKAHSKALAKMIPELTHSKESEEFNAILQSVAGDGFLQAAPLATTPDNILNTGFQILSELLLSEWNGKAAFSNQYYGPAEILSEILGDRVKEDGRIWDFAKNILEIDEEQSTISVNLKPYPNPLSLLNTTIPSATAQQQMLRGLSHGDFHSENVLARYSTTIQKMFVIDFDATKNDQPLLFDNAYLELSHLLKMRGDQSYDSWIDVCNQLVKIEDQKDVERDIEVNDDRGLLWTVGMLRGSIWRWQRNYHAARLDDLYKQALLARVGAGLNFAAKRSLSDDPVKSNKMKTLAFIYAASAAKGYYEFCKIPLSLNVKPIALIGSRPSPSNDSWRSVWRAADDFTASSGRYILVASEDLENLHSDNLNNLARLPWSLVIDLSKKTTDGLFYSVASTHMKLRGTFSALFPSQATAGRNDTDCCWLFAESNDDMGIADWRRAALPALRNQIRHEYQKITPLPLYLIVLGKRATPAKLRAIVSAAEEEVGSLLKTIVVVSDEDDTTNDSLRDEAGSFQAIKCSWTDFALGVLRMLGESHLETSPTTVPAYSAEQNAVRPLTLDREVASRYLTSLRLVGSRGLDAGQWTDEGIGRFYQGNLITWEELNLRHDIVREGYEGDKGWLNTIRSILKSNPSRSIKLLHSVGAGGTTVARRIAWDLRREFPAVIPVSSDQIASIRGNRGK